MESPFVYGKLASSGLFTDRQKETEQLIFNFSTLTNTILISPRRWGKSSLVHHAAIEAAKKEKAIKFCSIDLYNVKNEEQFYHLLAKELLRISATRMENIFGNAGKFLGRLIPKITYSPDDASEFSLGLDWQEVKNHPDDILDMAEKIAIEKNVKMVVCIDEFQNIGGFDDPEALQKKLRAHWQQHKNVSYCLYGSKRHMLMDIFASPSMPFYKFGEIMFLQKIDEKNWVQYIKKRFAKTGKQVSAETARLIAQCVECHPYYVQQLAQQSWLRTKDVCNNDIVLEAFDNLALQLSLLFQSLTDSFSNTQVNFLKAVLLDATQLSSKDTIHEFQLGTSANIQRIKEALINREIIDIFEGKIELLDPVYKYWLKKYYFKIRV